jgi:microcystin-dependent protein
MDTNERSDPVNIKYAEAHHYNFSIQSTGGSQPFAILPPFFVINYIIKAK